MKTIVVTDIHGCLEELESVWAQAGFDPETDKLICLGDLMDRAQKRVKPNSTPKGVHSFEKYNTIPYPTCPPG